MSKHQILVVDDTPIFRDPLASSLRLAGYETTCAANGEEALAAVRDSRPDLILLDLAMPVMDGVTFLRALKERGDREPIPVVVLSAASDQRLAFEAGTLGAGSFLLKSRVSLDEVLARVRQEFGEPTTAVPAGPAASAPRSPSPTREIAGPSAGPNERTPKPTWRGLRAVSTNGAVAVPDGPLVHLLCPRVACGRLLTVPIELRGTLITCAYCGGTLRVPPRKDLPATDSFGGQLAAAGQRR